MNEAGDYTTQKYPDSSYPAATQPDRKVAWIPANTIKDESGDTGRAEYMPEGYYTCTSASFLTPYDGCGDGVPSNGPPEVSAFNAAIRANQRSGTLTNEVCDDGGNADDACSADCKTIKDGYECLEWGKVCTPKCGNGHLEGKWVTTVDANGVSKTEFVYELDANGNQREECDFGTTFNSPDNYADIDATNYDYVRKYACSKDCKFVEPKFRTNPDYPTYSNV